MGGEGRVWGSAGVAGAILGLFGLLVGGASCRPLAPDLERLYAERGAGPRRPVIVIHGALGARLARREGGREVWPGGLFRLLTSDYRELELPIDPETYAPGDDGLVATGTFDAAAGKDFYRTLLSTLEGPGGYRYPTEGARGTLYPFFYDWRQGVEPAAARLDALIEGLRIDFDDPDLQVDLVAHSMGGLVARYYLRFGGEAVLDREQATPTLAGAAKVNTVVLLGTPNLGSISGLQVAIRGYRVGLGRIRPEVTATWSGAYQLLPAPGRTWMVDLRGEAAPDDLYDIETWSRFHWSYFDPKVAGRIRARYRNPAEAAGRLGLLKAFSALQLKRAERLHRALAHPLPRGAVRLLLFGGDCTPTPARCLVEEVAGRRSVRLTPEEIERPIEGIDYARLMVEPGDGRVTKTSALGGSRIHLAAVEDATDGMNASGSRAVPLSWSIFLCAEHGDLPANPTFRDHLLDVLLPAAPPPGTGRTP